MSHREERGIAERARKRTGMSALEKREAISQYLGTLAKATRIAPSAGAKMLAEVWEAKRRLDWGCTALVTVKA